MPDIEATRAVDAAHRASVDAARAAEAMPRAERAEALAAHAARPVPPGVPTPARPGTQRPSRYVFADNGFSEPPSAPSELLPTLVGATVHTFRYSTFIREGDLRAVGIAYDEQCGHPPSSYAAGKPSPLVGIFTDNPCPVLHLGYLASHGQRWQSNGTALGEVVYSLSLAPGETRNIAVIDLRRRQQGRRQEQTDANEQLISNQDHTFALQEVATAVALEHQHGKTQTEASTLVTGGAFVAAGALVGGIGGGLIGTAVEPGGGTAVGAAVGAGAGVAAGGLVFAGAQALGMIEAESSGDREIVADTNQRIAQSTSQQSALIRSLWSTVVTEDVQEENFAAQTSNITNYNHMHALNMEYFEILHRYETLTELTRAVPILYLPFGALPFQHEDVIDEFWDAIRSGLSDDLRAKGDTVFVEPPPEDFVPEPLPPEPDLPGDVTIGKLQIDVEVEWDLEWADAIAGALGVYFGGPVIGALMAFADEIFKDVQVEVELNGTSHIDALAVNRADDLVRGLSTWSADFDREFDAAEITGIRLEINSPTDIFDDGIHIRVLAAQGEVDPSDALTLDGLRIFSGQFEYDNTGRGREVYGWSPIAEALAEYATKVAEREAVQQRNDDDAAAHQAVLDQLAQWKQQVIDAIQREPYRFTMIVLSTMETGRLTWILDRLFITGDESDESFRVPLHLIAHTTPIGISGDSVLLRMKALDPEDHVHLSPSGGPVDFQTQRDLKRLIDWPSTIAKRFDGENEDLAVKDTVFLPGAGVFAEAVLGRSNASEFIDPNRYWNWQDSPIPHQAPQILPVSTDPRTTGPLPTDPTVPDANLPLVGAPDFPDPVGLAGILGAIQNGSIFRDMSKADQLAGILGGLAELAGDTAKTAATLTGDAASDALGSATEIGKTVASLTEQLMSKAPAQAAQPPRNPTTARAASRAVEEAEGKSPEVLDATKDAFGVPGDAPPPPTGGGAPPSSTPAQPWRPAIDPASLSGPGQVSSAPSVRTPIQEEVEEELVDILDTAAEDTGAMPDPSVLIPPLEHWYRDGIVPLLVFARHNEEYLTSAIGQYLDWLAAIQQLGLEDEGNQMESLHGDGMTLMRVGLENAIRAAFAQMESNNDLEFASDVFDWIALAMQLGMDSDTSPLFDANGIVDESPIHVVLDGPLEPPSGSGLGDQFDLTLSGGLAIGANPPLAGKVVDVVIDVDNGSAVPASGAVHPALDLVSTIERTASGPMTISVNGSAALFQGVWTFTTTRAVTIN